MPDLKFAAIAILASITGFLGWRLYDKSSETSELKASLVQQEAVNAQLITLSQTNAEAALKADEDRRRAVQALEDAQSELAKNTELARAADAEIDASSVDEDGPVAPVLQRLRAGRFGGVK